MPHSSASEANTANITARSEPACSNARIITATIVAEMAVAVRPNAMNLIWSPRPGVSFKAYE